MIKKALFAIIFSLFCLNSFAEPVPLDRIIAVVNDDVITENELDYRIAVIRDQMQDSGVTLPPNDILQPQVLDRLIEQMLVLQAADRYGVFIDDQALNQALFSIARQNNVSVSQLRDMLEDDGIDYEKFLDDLRTQITIQRAEQRLIGSEITLSQEEIEHLYQRNLQSSQQNKQYRLGHILVALNKDPNAEQLALAQARALEARHELIDPTEFHQIALRYSDSKDVLERADLGLRRHDELPSLFAEAVHEMEVGDVAGPFRNSSGLHIVQLLEVQEDEAQQIVDQTHVRHILLSTNQVRNDDKTRAELEQLRQEILDGEDFAKLARRYSEDLGTKQAGGDLEWMVSQQLDPAFAQAMEQLEIGEISAPVKSAYGWHIIQVLERRNSDMTENVLKAQIQERVYERKFNEALQNWYTQLRDQALIEVYI
jgi:peptidyl-prolyl cis-trans isomerase SurA